MCIFIRATIWVGFIPSLSPMSPLFYPFWQSFGGELLGSWAAKKRTKTPKTLFMRAIQEVTPPKFNSSPLKNHGKGRWIYFWDSLLLRGYVKFPGCIYIIIYIVKTQWNRRYRREFWGQKNLNSATLECVGKSTGGRGGPVAVEYFAELSSSLVPSGKGLRWQTPSPKVVEKSLGGSGDWNLLNKKIIAQHDWWWNLSNDIDENKALIYFWVCPSTFLKHVCIIWNNMCI